MKELRRAMENDVIEKKGIDEKEMDITGTINNSNEHSKYFRCRWLFKD